MVLSTYEISVHAVMEEILKMILMLQLGLAKLAPKTRKPAHENPAARVGMNA